MPTFFLPLKPNGWHQARLKAEAERTLWAVACMPWFGPDRGQHPTLGSASRLSGHLLSREGYSHHKPHVDLGYPANLGPLCTYRSSHSAAARLP
jgi:hypothetical protein